MWRDLCCIPSPNMPKIHSQPGSWALVFHHRTEHDQNPQSAWVLGTSVPTCSNREWNMPKTRSQSHFWTFQQNPQSAWVLGTCVPTCSITERNMPKTHSHCGFFSFGQNFSKSKNFGLTWGPLSNSMVQQKFLTWALMERSRPTFT